MTSMFDPIKAVLTPEMFAQVGQRLDIPADKVQQGVEIAIPLLTRGVAQVAETPEGQVAIAEAVRSADTGLLGSLSNYLGSFTTDAGADLLKRLFGEEGRVVVGVIKEEAGFDISPVLGMAGPLLLGFLGSTAQKEGLDTTGLVKKLRSEARSAGRKKGDAAAVVDAALEKVDEVRKLKGSFTAAEWATLRNGPLAAAATIIAAAPSGAARVAEEAAAAISSLAESTKGASTTSLIAALYHTSTDGLSVDGIADPLEAIKQALALVKRAAPGEVADYNKVLMKAAYAAAEAAKEGGFLGMGAKAVSKEEQAALDSLAATLGV